MSFLITTVSSPMERPSTHTLNSQVINEIFPPQKASFLLYALMRPRYKKQNKTWQSSTNKNKTSVWVTANFHSLKPRRSDSPKQLLCPCSSFYSPEPVSAGCLIAHFSLYQTPVQNLAQQLTFCILQLASGLRPPPAVTHDFQQTSWKQPLHTEKPGLTPKWKESAHCNPVRLTIKMQLLLVRSMLTGVSVRRGIRNLQSQLSGD